MPATVVINGLVIKAADYAENDRLITVLSAERGRITVIAKGGRSVRYRFLSSIQLFTYSTFELYERGGLYWLKEALVNTYFPQITESIENISLASYLAELTYELTGENESGTEMLRLFLNTLYTLADGSKPREIVKAVFELRAVCLSGYMPELSGCAECGNAECGYYYFDIMNGGIICPECFEEKSHEVKTAEPQISDSVNALGERNTYIPVSPGVVNTVRYILSADPKRVFAFRLDNQKDIYDLGRLAEIYATWHLGRGFASLDFYKTIVR